jgi:predicted transcriptional regulator YheO
MALHPVLEALQPLIADLVKAIGIPCEIVLHNLRDPSCSIIAIEGSITDREVGSPLTDLGLRLLRLGELHENLIGYATTAPDGRPLRSSTLYVRDEHGEVIGSICINVDLTYWVVMNRMINEICQTTPLLQSGGTVAETFDSSVVEVLKKSVERAINECGKPAPLMDKSEKLEVVSSLERSGVFLIRGAVDYIADSLGVSRPTVYNYLAELRSSEQFSSVSLPGQSVDHQ